MNRKGFGFVSLEKVKQRSLDKIARRKELCVDDSIDKWEGCYEKGWRKLITPESFAHPAKYSRLLIERVYAHAFKCGWIKKGDLVLDPFAGVALGGSYAMACGLNWIGVELETFFFDLGNGCECTGVSEEDYLRYNGQRNIKAIAYENERHWCPKCIMDLECKKKPSHISFSHYIGNIELWNRQLYRLPNFGTAKIIQGDSRRLKDMIKEVSLIVSSPPYADSVNSGRDGIDFSKSGRPDKMKKTSTKHYPVGAGVNRDFKYGEQEGQLGAMKEGSFDLITSSPPYEGSLHNQTDKKSIEQRGIEAGRKFSRSPGSQFANPRGYGKSDGNLAIENSDTFWSASCEIVLQCHELLKNGGHAIWVTKDYIKDKQKVPFSDRWLALCESVGFKLVCRHRAMLSRKLEYGKLIERKSFYRHLTESKGSPYIDWEDILCLIK